MTSFKTAGRISDVVLLRGSEKLDVGKKHCRVCSPFSKLTYLTAKAQRWIQSFRSGSLTEEFILYGLLKLHKKKSIEEPLDRKKTPLRVCK